MKGTEFLISGIDTDCGKTYITGLLAYHLRKAKYRIITTKLVQTGCRGISEDILKHRQIMESEILHEDHAGHTCPFVYSYPASPHLAAAIDQVPLDLQRIRQSTDNLLQNYELVLTEGAGGLMVPLMSHYFIMDYIREYDLPVILVCSSKLGSLNHSLQSIQLCLHQQVNLHAVIYNHFPQHDPIIAADSYLFIQNYLNEKSPATKILHSDSLKKESAISIDELFCL